MASRERLHTEEIGSGPRLVLLHGFTQAGATFRRVAEALADDFTVVLPDLPGHGRSSAIQADLPTAADLLVQSCGTATWFGYSMGGRHALHVALQHPEAVQRLVVLGATAGIADSRERAARRERDEALAERIEEIGVSAFVREWLALPLFARLPDDPVDLAIRLRNTPAGLAASLRLAGTGTQEPLHERLAAVTVPTLVLAGEHDAKFRTEAERLAAAIGPNTGPNTGANTETATIPDAGHAAHAEQSEAFLTLLRRWLNSHPALP